MNVNKRFEELSQRVSDLVPTELKVDFTCDEDGIVVDSVIVQADINKGITIRGEYPYNDTDFAGDTDLVCLNKNHIGKKMRDHKGIYLYTLADYLIDIEEILDSVEKGVYVVKRPPMTSAIIVVDITCAFS